MLRGVSRLSLKNLTVAVDPSTGPLFSPLTLELNSGETAFISGPSGSGKSTLLKAAARLIPTHGGQMLLDGKPAQGAAVPDYRRKVCYVAQVPVAHEESVENVLRRPFRYRSANTKEFPRDRALGLLEKLSLREVLGKSFQDLSVGERQRVCFIRAILLEPLFLLLDEPTSALDSRNGELLFEALSSLLPMPGLVIVTHDDVWKKQFDGAKDLELKKP